MIRKISKNVEVYSEVDVEVDITGADLNLDVVMDWAQEEASKEEIETLIQTLIEYQENGKKTLHHEYQTGSLSMFDVVEFIKNHQDEIRLHVSLFPLT